MIEPDDYPRLYSKINKFMNSNVKIKVTGLEDNKGKSDCQKSDVKLNDLRNHLLYGIHTNETIQERLSKFNKLYKHKQNKLRANTVICRGTEYSD